MQGGVSVEGREWGGGGWGGVRGSGHFRKAQTHSHFIKPYISKSCCVFQHCLDHRCLVLSCVCVSVSCVSGGGRGEAGLVQDYRRCWGGAEQLGGSLDGALVLRHQVLGGGLGQRVGAQERAVRDSRDHRS